MKTLQQKNEYEKLFDEFLDLIEFRLIKHQENWSVIDLQGANLGDIESDRFNNAEQIFDRLDIYINDYFITDIEECLEADGFEIPEWTTYIDLIKYARPLIPDNKWEMDVIDMICNHFNEINLNNCYYEEEDN